MKKKFDLIFEKHLCSINEMEYIDSTFEDNVRELAKVLVDFLPKKKTPEETINSAVDQVLNHDKGVKELFLGPQFQKQVKLHISQNGDSGTFQVEMVGEDVPEGADGKKIKTFVNNQHSESIFQDVADQIKRMSFDVPEDAVEELPAEQGAQAQPGGSEKGSALPAV